MVRQSTAHERVNPTNLSAKQKKAAILKLERRIVDLKVVDVSTIQERGDPKLNALEKKIDDTLVGIFGNNTEEYKRFRVGSLNTSPPSLLTPWSDVTKEYQKMIKGYQKSIKLAISNLQTAVDLFREKLEDLEEIPEGRAVQAFGNLDIHPEIKQNVGELFRDGHYTNAVEDACKVLDRLVKTKSGRSDLSGTDLMQTVFSPNKPILRFNDLSTETRHSEQQGMMFLYSGAMLALRNPRAHELIKDDPEQALEYIGFLSLLAKLLDRTEKADDKCCD